MSKLCDWCKKESTSLNKYSIFGMNYYICPECNKAAELGVCRTCGESLFGEITLGGECSKCQQISSAKLEKQHSEILNGLGMDVLEQLASSTEFTEKDYENWVTFGQGNFTVADKARLRENWVKVKIAKELGWSTEKIKDNVDDIRYLLSNYSVKLFGPNYRFVDKGNRKDLHGVNILAQRGNLAIIESN